LSAQVVNFRVPRPVQFSRAVDSCGRGDRGRARRGSGCAGTSPVWLRPSRFHQLVVDSCDLPLTVGLTGSNRNTSASW